MVAEIPITISGIDDDGHIFREETRTIDVSRRGAKIASANLLAVGTYLWIENPSIVKSTVARVVRHGAQNPANSTKEICVILPDLDPPGSIWGINSPPQDWQNGSVAPTAASRLERIYARDWVTKFESISNGATAPNEVAEALEPQPEPASAFVQPNEPSFTVQAQPTEHVVLVMGQHEKPLQINASTSAYAEERTPPKAAQIREGPASDVEERLKQVYLAMESLEGRVRALAENFQGHIEGSLQASRGNAARQAEDLEKIAQELGGQWSQQFQEQAEAAVEKLRQEVKNSGRALEESKQQLAGLAEEKVASLSQAMRDEYGPQLAQAFQERAEGLEKIAQELGGQWSQQFQQQAEAAVEKLREEVKNSGQALEESKQQLAGLAEEKVASLSQAMRDEYGPQLAQAFQERAEGLEKIAQELGGQWSQQFQEQAEAAVEKLREEVKNSGQALEESKQQLAGLAEEKVASLSQATRDEYGQQLAQAFQERAQEIHAAAEGEVKSIKEAAEEAIAQLQSKFQEQAEAAVERLREEVKNSGRAVEESKQQLAGLAEEKLAFLSQATRDEYGQQLAQAFQERAQEIHAAAEGEVKSIKQAAEEAIAQLQSKFQEQAEAAVESLRGEVENSERAVEESKRQLAGLTEAGLASLSQANRDEYGPQLAQAFQARAEDLERIAQELGGQWSQQFQEQAEAAVGRLREEVKNSGRALEESKRQLAGLAEAGVAPLSQANRDEYGQQLAQAFQERAQEIHSAAEGEVKSIKQAAEEAIAQLQGKFQEQAEAAVEKLREEVKNSGQALEESKQQLAGLAEEKVASLSQAMRDEYGPQLAQAFQERAEGLEKIAQELGGQWSQQFQEQAEAAVEKLREEVKNSGQALEESKQQLASLAEEKVASLSQAMRDEYGPQLAQAFQERAEGLEKIAQELGGQWSQQFQEQAEAAVEKLREEVKNSGQALEESKQQLASLAEEKVASLSQAMRDEYGPQLAQAFQERAQEIHAAAEGEVKSIKEAAEEAIAQLQSKFQEQAEAAVERLREEVKDSGRTVEESKQLLATLAEGKPSALSQAIRDEYGQQLAQAVRERAQDIHAAAEGEVKSIKQAAEEAIAQLQLAEQRRETSFLAQAGAAEQRLTGVSLAVDALLGEFEGKHTNHNDELKKIAQELGARFSQQCQKQAEAAADKLRAEMKNSGRAVEEIKRQLASVADAKLATFSRVAANAAAGLEAEQRELKHQYEASRKDLENLVARRLAKLSAGSIHIATPSTGRGIAVKLALVAGLFLLMVASVLGVSLSTTHPVIQLQSDPPAEFIDDNPSWNAKRRAREEDVSQAFWRAAVMDIQERYPFGSQLPFDPPDEFQVDKKYVPTGGPKTLADTRIFYWDKLRDIWGQRKFWVESQEADSPFGARLRRIWDAIKGKPA